MARILVVDDETAVRRLLRRVLERAGHDVLEASDGTLVPGLLDTHSIDLMILDVFMPEREGLETLADVRKRHARLQVLVISGGGSRHDLDYLQMAKKLGANEVLAKPIANQTLLATVSQLLSQG